MAGRLAPGAPGGGVVSGSPRTSRSREWRPVAETTSGQIRPEPSRPSRTSPALRRRTFRAWGSSSSRSCGARSVRCPSDSGSAAAIKKRLRGARPSPRGGLMAELSGRATPPASPRPGLCRAHPWACTWVHSWALSRVHSRARTRPLSQVRIESGHRDPLRIHPGALRSGLHARQGRVDSYPGHG